MHPRKASAPPVQQQIHQRQHNHHRQHRHSCVHHQQALRRQSCHWDRLVGSGGYSSEHELIAPASPCSSEGRRKRATLASLGGGRSYFDQRFPHLVIKIEQFFNTLNFLFHFFTFPGCYPQRCRESAAVLLLLQRRGTDLAAIPIRPAAAAATATTTTSQASLLEPGQPPSAAGAPSVRVSEGRQ